MPTVRDPVCGMTIDRDTAAGCSIYRGDSYYFCSKTCQSKFDSGPSKYVGDEATQPVEDPEPRFTKFGPVVAPKFGSAGSGGAEYERGPDQRWRESGTR